MNEVKSPEDIRELANAFRASRVFSAKEFAKMKSE
jgi:hypothetical protein